MYLYVLSSTGCGSQPTPNWYCKAFDKGTFHISSCPQLQATAVQIDGVADPKIDLRLEFLLFKAM